MDKAEIAEYYTRKHATDLKFSNGTALLKHIPEIVQIYRDHHCKSILDYGCGKAVWWNSELFKPVFHCEPRIGLYDPYVPEYSKPVNGRYDLVICTDVMEHIPEDEVQDVINKLFKLTRRVLFVNISTVPARKRFPDGTNIHITIKTEKEWTDMFHKTRIKLEKQNKTNYRVVLRFDDQVGTR